MKFISRIFLITSILVMYGCAHPITISPHLSNIDRKDAKQIDKNVGYYISAQDRYKEVTTPGGGGDSIKYTPYNDLEPAIQKVLINIFRNVHRMPSENDKVFISDNDISFVFTPKIETSSSSSGVLTWMATDFTVDLNVKAINEGGDKIWEKTIKKDGHAEFEELTKDLQLSSRRASEKVFKELQQAISNDPAFD
ncbi:MAG: hypothetical protein RPU52_13165 [Candidatus Sedimenticola sp. (ex Thyasira tokunagai)]